MIGWLWTVHWKLCELNDHGLFCTLICLEGLNETTECLSWIRGSHSDGYEDFYLLGYNAIGHLYCVGSVCVDGVVVLCVMCFGEPHHTHRAQHHNPAYTHRTNTILTTYYEGTRPSLGFTARLINRKIILFSRKHILTLTRQHMHIINEAFPLKCWLSSDDGYHWPKHVQALFYY
jgi:hypothetical protein